MLANLIAFKSLNKTTLFRFSSSSTRQWQYVEFSRLIGYMKTSKQLTFEKNIHHTISHYTRRKNTFSNTTNYSNFLPTIQKRTFFTWLTTLTPQSALALKVLLGASLPAAYVGYYVWSRRLAAQKKYILNTLRSFPVDMQIPELSFDRKEEKILAQYFATEPSGPSVIIGPEGAGKNTILKKIIGKRRMTLWIDLKQNPVTTGEDFLRLFIENSGYLLPQSGDTMWTLLFLAVNRKLSGNDYDKALGLLSDVLQEEKDRGWPEGVPVICVDDMHRFGSFNDLELRNSKASDDKNFLKFIDWCIHVSDRKLAHIVFVTSYSFAHLDLDAHAGFRHRRSLISIHFAESDIVKQFLTKVVVSDQNVTPLSPEAIDTIVRCIGGQVEDVDRVVTGLKRGDSYINILRSMLTDSIAYVEDHLSRILDEATRTNDELSKQRVYEKYIRFWKMMEMINTNETVNKRVLMVNLFNLHSEEIESLLASNILSFVNEKFPDTVGKKQDSIFALLNSSLDSIALAAGSPKLRTSFGLLLKDEKMVKQKNWVVQQLESKMLREREKEWLDKKRDLTQEQGQVNIQLEKLVVWEEKWANALGREEYEKRKKFLMQREVQVDKEIEICNTKLLEVRNELSKLS